MDLSLNLGSLELRVGMFDLKRQRRVFPLFLPSRNPAVSLVQWLRDAIRSEIISGTLKPGHPVPSTRDLAKQCGVSRGTVVLAVEDLKSEGYLEGVRGSGTFISGILPDRFLQGVSRGPAHVAPESNQRRRISDYAGRVRPISHFVSPMSLAFRTNLPALDLFPTGLWAQVVSQRARGLSSGQLLGCPPGGYAPLRETLCRYLGSARGVRCEPSQIVILSGVQEAIDLTARLLLNPGDTVMIEDPGYQVAVNACDAVGARVMSMSIDESGAAPTRKMFRDARLMYVTPSHQFPTGVSMPLKRRIEILQAARETNTYIFEDDYDSEYRYSGNPIPAMQGIDRDGLVIFAGSFNKVLFPSLRMGYIVLPPALVETFEAAKSILTRHHPVLEQAAMCDFMEKGHFGRHLRRMRKIYAARLEALAYYAGEELGDVLKLSDIEAGLQTVGWLREGLLATKISEAAALEKVDVVPLHRYAREEVLPEAIQIGFAAVDELAIKHGVRILAKVFEGLSRPGRS